MEKDDKDKLNLDSNNSSLPPSKDEYQVYSGHCECCKSKKYGMLPEGIGNRYFGAKAHVINLG